MRVVCAQIKITLLFVGVMIQLIAFSSFCYGGIFLSPDIPVSVGTDFFLEQDILHYDTGDFSLYLSGPNVGIPDGVNIDAIGVLKAGVLFSVDIPTTIAGLVCTEKDIILYNKTGFNKFFDGQAAGMPDGASIDAATLLSDGSMLFSTDIPVILDSKVYKENDLIQYDGFSFTLFFHGRANGIPSNADINAVSVNSNGDILFSFDITCEIEDLIVSDKDIVSWNGASFSLEYKGDDMGFPVNGGINAISLFDMGNGDMDSDGDIDGLDLVDFMTALMNGYVSETDLTIFAENYGQ
jgi:hypothetical protein